MPANGPNNGDGTNRDRYRDNDDVRDKLDGRDRSGTNPDTRAEARGEARENVGNHSRNTAASPREGGNDHTKSRRDADPQNFQDDLDADNSR